MRAGRKLGEPRDLPFVGVGHPGEERLAQEHLGNDAASRPEVHLGSHVPAPFDAPVFVFFIIMVFKNRNWVKAQDLG